MLRLASVHPAPRRALKRVVKNRHKTTDGSESDGEGVREATNVTAAVASAMKQEGVKDERDAACASTSDSDSDWNNDDGSDGDLASSELDEEEDSDEHRRALQAELDECADDSQDVYLERMLAVRDRLEGDDAAWVDQYIELQQQWKDRHAFSIDAFDLDVKLKPRALARTSQKMKKRKHKATSSSSKKTKARRGGKQRVRRPYSRCLRAFWRVWYKYVAPQLPHELQEERAEYVLALMTALAFVVLSLAIQLYASLRAFAPESASGSRVDG